jgi:hypothetical protein
VKKTGQLKSALVVVGGSIAAAPASALELGEAKIHSTLGQPLRASIAYALGPNEMISDTCVTLLPATGSGGLRSVDRGSVSVADGVITITGKTAVREPIMSMRVNIRCPYTPRLTRDYLLLVDPAATPGAAVAAATPERRVTQPRAAQRPVARRTASGSPQAVKQAPVVSTSRYQVQPGDSLSVIAQRIENRPVGLQQAVDAIFAANPRAFAGNDPNKLKAGSWLEIPDFGVDSPREVMTAPAQADPITAADTTAALPPVTAYEPAAMAVTPVDTDTATTADEQIIGAVEAAAAQPLAELRPGDVIVNSDNPFVETVTIPDTRLEGPKTTSTSPNVPIAVIRQPAATESAGGTNWLLWLGGGGIALFLGLLLLGGRLRERFGSTPIAPAMPQRRATDADTGLIEVIADDDETIDDDSPTAENLALDADLVIGTGLQPGEDVQIASDFAFASTTMLDLEFPEEVPSDQKQSATDIIPPINIDESSILESEILPDADDDDDEYDMSVILDATKMPNPEDVTERDLEAIEVEDDDEAPIAGDYTVSQEVDYKILEQDYEDEMTATQALNAEIQKAAEDLATRHDNDAEAETAELQLATVHEFDVTAQLPQSADVNASNDDGDTSINPTVSLEAADDTVEMNDERTLEMPKKDSKAS